MAKDKIKPEEVVSLQLTKGELFQLHLCVVCRSATATVKWTNATSKEEQTALQQEIAFLTVLTEKLTKELGKNEA